MAKSIAPKISSRIIRKSNTPTPPTNHLSDEDDDIYLDVEDDFDDDSLEDLVNQFDD